MIFSSQKSGRFDLERISLMRSFFVSPLVKRRLLHISFISIILGWSLTAVEPMPLATQVRELRKQHLIMVALPPAKDGKISNEQRQYLKKLNAFLSGPATGDLTAKSMALFLRGQFYCAVKQYPLARVDYDACIRSAAECKKTANGSWPSSLPSEITLRIFRALAFVDQGDNSMVSEMEAIPATEEKPLFHDVGEPLQEWAEKLADSGNYPLAVKVYSLIKKFHLWGDDPGEPDRRIELLKIQAKNLGVNGL